MIPILIKNDAHIYMTSRCISEARINTRIPFDLIIVESGSTYFQDEADIHIYEKIPTTPEIGHNLGFRVGCRYDKIVLLTNDTFMSKGWLETLLDTFNKKPDCGFSTLGAERFGHNQEDKIEEGFWFDVAMIDRKVFDEIGFYDERFIGSWPDTDLLVRAYKMGWKMYRNFNCIIKGELNHATVGMNPKHQENYDMGRKIFREKHEGCGLAIYEAYK